MGQGLFEGAEARLMNSLRAGGFAGWIIRKDGAADVFIARGMYQPSARAPARRAGGLSAGIYDAAGI